MYQIAIDNLGFQPEKVLAVGDQMGTDIAAGIAAGCLTGLVLTGVSDENAIDDFPFKPTYVAQSLTDLINELS
jgi:NagD protein